MPELQEMDRRGDKVFYEPIVLKVSGVSQYNPDQISFEGVPDFWQLPAGMRTPPEGTIARFYLATKPKTSPRAKPGSRYCDIVDVRKADASEYSGPPSAPRASYAEKGADAVSAHPGANAEQLPPIEQRILLGMTYNNLTAMLASPEMTADAINTMMEEIGFDPWEIWYRWTRQASRGLPLTPVADEEPDDIERAIGEAQQVEMENAAAEDDVETLPW